MGSSHRVVHVLLKGSNIQHKCLAQTQRLVRQTMIWSTLVQGAVMGKESGDVVYSPTFTAIHKRPVRTEALSLP